MFALASPLVLALAAGAVSPAPAPDVEELLRRLTGSFSSAAQAGADSAYFDIRLHAVPIWTNDRSSRWIYLEQAAADRLETPYRQRVYRIGAAESGTFFSEVFEIPEPLRFAGAWRSETPLASLPPDSLDFREGCTVVLRLEDDVFEGGTVGQGCSSSLRGASYATSEVRVFADRLESWDRGFDAEGRQVWGAEDGPFVFRRVEEAAGRTP